MTQTIQKLTMVDVQQYASSVTFDKKACVKLNPKLFGDEQSNPATRAHFKKFTWEENKIFVALSDVFSEYQYENYAQFVQNTDRDVRAWLLIAQPKGIEATSNPHEFLCQSLSRPRTHHTSIDNCDCEDHQYRGIVCYHMLAVQILTQRGLLPRYYPSASETYAPKSFTVKLPVITDEDIKEI